MLTKCLIYNIVIIIIIIITCQTRRCGLSCPIHKSRFLTFMCNSFPDFFPCHSARPSSIFSLGRPLSLLISVLPTVVMISSLSLLITRPENDGCLFVSCICYYSTFFISLSETLHIIS